MQRLFREKRLHYESISRVFEEQLNKEMLISEKVRTLLLAGLSGFLLIIMMAISVAFKDDFERVFKGNFTLYWIFVLVAMLLIRELFVRRAISKVLKTNKKVSPVLFYMNSLIEVSTPTLAIVVFAENLPPVYSLVTPVALAYFLFIVLSTLELNFQLSVFTGTVAAVEYVAISYFYLQQAQLPADLDFLTMPTYFLGKGLIMFLTGVVAGFVALEIKKRILHSYEVMHERNQLERMFGQQVSQAIVDEMISSKREVVSRRRNVCIMFIDIRDFSRFSNGKSPEEIVKYQNEVFSFMIDSISRNHGIINQFLGDGLMATFGAPVSYENDCLNAVNAAMEIIKAAEEKSLKGIIPHTKVGIGIHTGEAITGNVGTQVRKQYSITGNVVILASRIEQLNKEYGSCLLVSEEVINAVGAKRYCSELIGPVLLKGQDEPVTIYRLV